MKQQLRNSFLFVFLMGAYVNCAFGQPDIGFETQSNTVLRPLKIGDPVPGVLFSEIINYKKKQADLHEFRGKLLILDFWSIFCSVCIAGFPKIESLQKKFDGKVQILTVGLDALKDGSIKDFIEKENKTKSKFNLPTVIIKKGDSALNKLFPFQGLPHVIWIDSSGLFLGASNHLSLTSKNIENYLSGISLPFNDKVFIKRSFNDSDTFLIHDKSVCKASAITGYNETLNRDKNISHDSQHHRIRIINYPILSFYQLIYKDSLWLNAYNSDKKRVLMISNEKSFYKNWDAVNGMDNWEYEQFERENLFCYELMLPVSFSKKEMLDYMKEDIDRFFMVKSSIEKRKVKCLLLTRTSNVDKMKSTLTISNLIPDRGGDYIMYQKISVKSLIDKLDGAYLDTVLPVFDNTDYKDDIDIALPKKSTLSLETIRKELAKYDLDLVEATRQLPMLILKDVKNISSH